MPSGLNVMDDGCRKAAMVESPLITSSCPVPAVVVTVPSFTFKHRMRWLPSVADVDEMGQDGVWRDASGIFELGFLAHAIHHSGSVGPSRSRHLRSGAINHTHAMIVRVSNIDLVTHTSHIEGAVESGLISHTIDTHPPAMLVMQHSTLPPLRWEPRTHITHHTSHITYHISH